ncbi:MAG: cytochrome c oxidase subunit [Pseudonocardiales bacterium]|nr:cytochrome c oxidase subunit [Pseudonocardiales bacterium]
MRRRRWVRGGRATVLLAALTLVLTGCSAQDWERNLRFGFPTGATKEATQIRVLWTWAGVVALALGVVVWGLIFWCVIRYRKKSDELPRQTKYNFTVEAVCFTFPFIVIAGLFYRTVVVEDNVNHLSANPDVRIQVDAFKWNWQFEYHQYTDANGKVHQTFYPGQRDLSDAAGNTLEGAGGRHSGPSGLVCDEASSNLSVNCGASGLDDTASGHLFLSTVGSQYEIPVLVIPVDRTVRFVEHSEDVVHSFWVPEFLFKRDVIPFGTTSTARDNQFEITATQVGNYVGRCAEFCGTYHSQMNFEVRVVTEDTFETYLESLEKIGPADPDRQAKALRLAGMEAYATTTYPLDSDRASRHELHAPGG